MGEDASNGGRQNRSTSGYGRLAALSNSGEGDKGEKRVKGIKGIVGIVMFIYE